MRRHICPMQPNNCSEVLGLLPPAVSFHRPPPQNRCLLGFRAVAFNSHHEERFRVRTHVQYISEEGSEGQGGPVLWGLGVQGLASRVCVLGCRGLMVWGFWGFGVWGGGRGALVSGLGVWGCGGGHLKVHA